MGPRCPNLSRLCPISSHFFSLLCPICIPVGPGLVPARPIASIPGFSSNPSKILSASGFPPDPSRHLGGRVSCTSIWTTLKKLPCASSRNSCSQRWAVVFPTPSLAPISRQLWTSRRRSRICGSNVSFRFRRSRSLWSWPGDGFLPVVGRRFFTVGLHSASP